LFHWNSNSTPIRSMHGDGDCPCQQGQGAPFMAPVPPVLDSSAMPGQWSARSTKDGTPLPIPITNMPSPPPQFPKNVMAQPTPFSPAN
jgi:hypothetical protein